jgi:hypothetical protein
MVTYQNFKKFKKRELRKRKMGNARDEAFVEAIYATEAYIAKREKEFKERTAGKPDEDCVYCEGTGVRYAPNGPDDFDAEECLCVFY